MAKMVQIINEYTVVRVGIDNE